VRDSPSPRLRRVAQRLLAVLAASLFAPLVVAAPAGAREESTSLPPVQVVILADESASMVDPDIVNERDAARTIAFSMLAAGSQLSVVGFGSDDGQGRSPLDVVCSPRIMKSEQDRDALAACISGLHRRAPSEGDQTDQAAALLQAWSIVRSGKFAKKIIFMLTDGRLDVSQSPRYGADPQQRDAAAKAQVNQTLVDLAGAGAQVWPIGFGEVDRAALDGLARGKSCTPAMGDPHALILSDSSRLTDAVSTAFSSATCVKYGRPDTTDVSPGGSNELRTVIPPGVSTASILVYKRDQRVKVEYFAPGAGGPTVGATGRSTDVESIAISDPSPGPWTIRLSSADVSVKDVTAVVVYQSAVQTYLVVNPPQPAPGQRVTVEMQVRNGNQAVIDEAALTSLSFVATLTGAGFGQQRVALADTDGDGTFDGSLTVPAAASGALQFTGQATGVGIAGDPRLYTSKIEPGGMAVQASIIYRQTKGGYAPGSKLPGQVSVRNESGRPQRLRLVADESSPDAPITVEPTVVTAPAGTSSIPFVMTIGEETTSGVATAVLRLVRDANPSSVVAERLVAVPVQVGPAYWQRTAVLWLPVVVMVVAVAITVIVGSWARGMSSPSVGSVAAWAPLDVEFLRTRTRPVTSAPTRRGVWRTLVDFLGLSPPTHIDEIAESNLNHFLRLLEESLDRRLAKSDPGSGSREDHR